MAFQIPNDVTERLWYSILGYSRGLKDYIKPEKEESSEQFDYLMTSLLLKAIQVQKDINRERHEQTTASKYLT